MPAIKQNGAPLSDFVQQAALRLDLGTPRSGTPGAHQLGSFTSGPCRGLARSIQLQWICIILSGSDLSTGDDCRSDAGASGFRITRRNPLKLQHCLLLVLDGRCWEALREFRASKEIPTASSVLLSLRYHGSPTPDKFLSKAASVESGDVLKQKTASGSSLWAVLTIFSKNSLQENENERKNTSAQRGGFPQRARRRTSILGGLGRQSRR